MKDSKWLEIDEKIYKFLVYYFHLDLLNDKELNKYYDFRNDTIDLFNKEEDKKND